MNLVNNWKKKSFNKHWDTFNSSVLTWIIIKVQPKILIVDTDWDPWLGISVVLDWIAFLYIVYHFCLVIIKSEYSLHEPLYLFLAMIGAIHIATSTRLLPKLLGIFWLHISEIVWCLSLSDLPYTHFLVYWVRHSVSGYELE